ncbi:MAG: DUF3885 domain-containing protein [Caulobacteraceae bacterium]|nr:MAG: DUF3885 domain-containing protein [Caulobacteraceae bacterium]
MLSLGPDWQRDLSASPYRLRFELNAGGPYVTMFTGSYDRARALARAALPGDQVTAVVAAYHSPKREFGAKWRGWTKGTAFEILENMGVPTEPVINTWSGYWWDGLEDDEPWVHRAIRLTWDQADILLWNQCAHDMGVTPHAPVFSKLVDLERAVSVHAYDDRGMDITALSRATISDLYGQYDAWLLDYDRPRMSSALQE